MEGSLSEVGTSKPHFLETPHTPVSTKKNHKQQQQIQTRKIADKYAHIWCMYHPFAELIIIESNSQHSMLYFHNVNTVSWQVICQLLLPTFMLASMVIH